MKKILQYSGMRSVRLGALAVLVATFVGLPALGRALGTTMFDKIDAVNYLSNVLLAEDYMGGTYSGGTTYTQPTYTDSTYSGSTTYTQPTYTDSTYSGSTTYTQPTYSGSTTYTQPTYSGSTTYTQPTYSGSTTYTQPTYSGSTTYTQPTYSGSTTYTQPTYSGSTTYTDPNMTQYGTTGTTQYGTTGTTQYGTTGTQQACTTPDQCAQMSNGQFKSTDFTCTNGYCSMAGGTQYGQTGTQYGTQTTCAQGTTCNTQYNQYSSSGTSYNGTQQYGTQQYGQDGQMQGQQQYQQYGTQQYGQNGQMQNGTQQYQQQQYQQYQTTGQFMPGQSNTQYTDFSSRSEKYGDFAQYFTDQQGGTQDYGFQNCSDEGCSFQYDYQGDKYQQEMGSQVTSQKSNLERELKQNSNVAKNWSRFSSRTSRLATKFTAAASKISAKGGDTSILTTLIQGLAGVDADVTGVINEINTYYNSLSTSISALSETSTQGDVESIRTGMQLLRTYDMLSGAMETRMNAIQMSEGFSDMLFQITAMEAQFNGDVPAEVQANIEDILSQISDLVGYVDKANDSYKETAQQIAAIRGYTDPQDIQQAMQESFNGDNMRQFMDEMQNAFNDFWNSRPFDSLHGAERYAQNQQLQGSMGDQLSGMKEGLASAKQFLASLKTLNITKPTVVSAIASLNDSATKMTSIMDKMKSALDAAGGKLSGDQMDKFFQIQESMMQSVDTNMKVVTDYLNSNKSTWSTGANKDIISGFLADEVSNKAADRQSYNDSFDEVYGDIGTEGIDMEALKAKIKADVIAEVTREISATLMAEVAKYIGDDKAGEILSNFLNKSTIFGEKGTAALQATTDVLGTVDTIPTGEDVVITKGTEDEVETLQATIDDIKAAVISEDLSNDMKSSLAEAADVLSTGGEPAEIKAIDTELKSLLAKNDSSLTDNGLQFNDIKIADSADTWYFDSVMSLRQDGVVKGKGEGNYDPAGEVTYAEVAKMAMEAAGEGKSNSTPSDSSAKGQWYEGYVSSVEKNAPEFAKIVEGNKNIDWNDPCPREYVAVLIGEAFDLEKSTYEGKFKDVSASDPYVGYLQAVADYGIMTGDSKGGTYRPTDGINRAEVAKVIYTADQSVGTTQDIGSTLSSADEFLNTLDLGESSNTVETGGTSVMEKLTSFFHSLRAMLPFLN